MTRDRKRTILITEDDDGHAELIRAGLIKAGIQNPLQHCRHGLEAWNRLTDNSLTRNNNDHLLLLDLNMPVMNGLELLKRIKCSDTLRNTPVIVLTTTDDPDEISRCYSLGCNFCVSKPVDFDDFAETLCRIGRFIEIVLT